MNIDRLCKTPVDVQLMGFSKIPVYRVYIFYRFVQNGTLRNVKVLLNFKW